MERTDSHTHTFLSRHGRGTVDEVVEAACSQGMTMVALTEHLPLPSEVDDGTFAMEPERMAEYFALLDEARQRHPDIEIITGTEIDWRYGAEDYLLGWTRRWPFELLLGSVHMLTDAEGNQWEFDHPGYAEGWNERGEEAVWREYFELWMQALQSAVPFDLMTHPDLPKKLGHKPSFDTREYYHAMAEAAAAAGVLIEVNTSGLHKPVKELYPAPQLLKAFRQAGVACTISSDAHAPEHVGRDFDLGYAAMRAAGYTHVAVPTRTGDRREIPLD
ncbi:MAG: histidinol-phosphatase HisJ family protein [Coriobacteriales bacterium]|jgi:histidinol-phosphatase (PHP family)|nr:histidinol-phosphatase HisJ family protein [Coriobacteriales bacterium]